MRLHDLSRHQGLSLNSVTVLASALQVNTQEHSGRSRAVRAEFGCWASSSRGTRGCCRRGNRSGCMGHKRCCRCGPASNTHRLPV